MRGYKDWKSLRAGTWLSPDKSIVIYQQMAGTAQEQWEAYKEKDPENPTYDYLVTYNLTLKETIDDIERGDINLPPKEKP